MLNTDWIDREEYPFEPHVMRLEAGRMHYVDEGRGAPLVLVHGTPTWSFLYRHLIKDLSKNFRVVAPDHLGFGLSDKPAGWVYRPADHARNLSRLIETLGLKDIVLAVHDFGGPVGLSYAVEHAENVAGLILFNTWMWSLADRPDVVRAGRLLGGTVGKFLYEWLNFSPRVLLKMSFGDRSKLTKEVHRHYLRVFPTRQDRHATWVLARELIGSSDWYEQLWRRRDQLRRKPALLLWGMRDKAFRADALARWGDLFENKKIVEFAAAGHFVQEEDPARAAAEIENFLRTVELNSTAGRANSADRQTV